MSALKTLWHRLLAKLLEILLAEAGVTVLSELPATSNPPQIDILLLRREGDHWTEEQQARLPDGVRDRTAGHHLLECKLTESVTEQSFQQALTYDYLYRQSQQLAAAEVQTYIVSARTPLTGRLTEWGYTVEQPGVYVSTLPLLHNVVLLVLNELRNTPHNDYFRLFASRQQVRQSAFATFWRTPLAKWPAALWAVLFALQKAYELEGAETKMDVTLESLLAMGEEMRKQVIASAAPEERLAGLGPEERLAGLGPEERLAGLEPEERLAGLGPEEIEQLLAHNEQLRKEAIAHAQPEERLAGLGPAELLALMKQIEAYLQNQQAAPDNPRDDTKPQ